LLNILFETSDIIEIRCLHKDQLMKQGRAEPAPHIFWGTWQEHGSRLQELQRLNTMGYNIYFGINPRAGKSKTAVSVCRSLVVDIDHKSPDEAAEWLNVMQAEWQLPYPSAIVNSGNGVHYYWRLNAALDVAQWHTYQKAIIATFNLSGKIADPVIHDAPRIMRLPGFVNHKGGNVAARLEFNEKRHLLESFSYCLENYQPPAPPQPRADYTGENVGALERALRYHEKRDGCGEGGRNAECYKIAACCQNDFGLSPEDCYHVIATWNLKNKPSLPESEIREVIEKAKRHSAANPTYSKDRPKPEKIKQQESDEMPYDNTDYSEPEDLYENTNKSADRTMAGIDLGIVEYMVENYVLIAGTTDVWDLEHGIMMPCSALSLLFPREIKYWKTDPNRKVILSENLVFEPSGKIKEGQINSFQGFLFQKDDRPMPLLMAHLEMLCNDNTELTNWVYSWCALQVQQPGTKIASSIIMHGKQGTGKSMFWECFGQIFAPYYGVIDQTILESNFNSWASRKMFVLAEEVLANQSKGRLKNVVKQMITGGLIQINQKNTKEWVERCYMNLVFLSNNRLPMLLDEDDRRFCVISHGADRVMDKPYYDALAAEIADNGPARLYSSLLKWDLQGFDAHTKPPMTDAKRDMILLVRDTCKTFLEEWLIDEIEGLPCGPAKKQDLYDAYTSYCRASGLRSNSRKHFYSIIADEYPQLSERRLAYGRYFVPDHRADSDLIFFSEALGRYIARIQDRKL